MIVVSTPKLLPQFPALRCRKALSMSEIPDQFDETMITSLDKRLQSNAFGKVSGLTIAKCIK